MGYEAGTSDSAEFGHSERRMMIKTCEGTVAALTPTGVHTSEVEEEGRRVERAVAQDGASADQRRNGLAHDVAPLRVHGPEYTLKASFY